MTTQHGNVLSLITALRRRQRAVNAVRGLVHGAFVAGVAVCAASVIARASGQAELTPIIVNAATVAVLCIVGGALLGALSPVSDLALARALDRAGKGQDRFASALQLLNDRHADRAQLVVEDALAHVSGTPAAAALPMRMPRTARWAPVPFLALVAILLLMPSSRLQAAPTQTPEISPDQWNQIADEFNKELAQLPRPLTADEQEMQKELERLSEKLKQAPDKKEALKEIARLSDRVEKEQKQLGAKEVSLRKAAKAVAKSAALKALASKMQQGQYTEAAEELENVAAQMQNGELSPDAEEFEAMAQDLDQLAKEAEADQELSKECQSCSSAAAKMNKKELSDALKKLSQQIKKNAGKYSKSDSLARHKKLLDSLKRKMNCQNCCDGDCDNEGFCQNPGKGGKKAGWASAAKWDGGKLHNQDEKRSGEMVDPQETNGESTSFQMVSPDERARSSKKYAELYAEFVQMTEADLDLESVPLSQREYLRKYFNSIRPKEAAPEGKPKEENTEPANP